MAFRQRTARTARLEALPEAHPADQLLEVDDLHTSFDTPRGLVRAVDGVSLSVGRGRTLGIVGESGSGKTVLSRSIMGLLTSRDVIRSGSVRYQGQELLDASPSDSRANLPGYEWLKSALTDKAQNEKVRRLKVVADDLGISLAELSLAWCVRNPHVSTVITGASRVEQVEQNMKALDAVPLLTPDVLERIDQAVA